MLSIRHPRQVLFWGALLWAAALSVTSVQPQAVALFFLRTTELFPFAHAAAYGSLCFVLCLYFRFERKSPFAASVLALFATLVLGIGTEAAQAFSPDRTPDLMDVHDDMVGALIGTGIFLLMLKTALFRKPRAIQLELFPLRAAHGAHRS